MTRKQILLATSLLAIGFAAPSLAMADTVPAPAPQMSESGVLTFGPDFFAGYNPNSALDMINRLPGFSVNDGDGARGFEGAVGNILINGARPASKNDTGSSVLGRTTASQVERIELIRGGASGIDMQGYGVVVNVVLKNTASTEQVATFQTYLFDGGQDLFGASYQYTRRSGDYTWGVVLSDGISTSDSNGTGPLVRVDGSGNVLRSESYYNDGYGGSHSIRGNWAGPFAGGRLDTTARFGDSDWHNIDIQTGTDVLRDSRADSKSHLGDAGITYTRNLSAKLALETRLIHEFEKFSNSSTSNVRLNGLDEDEQNFTAKGNSSESIARALVRIQRNSSLDFEVGGEIAYNMLEIDQNYSIGGTNIPLPSASVKVEETRGELFGKGTWRINPKWTLEAGLRLENSTISQSGDANQKESFFFAKPRALLSWSPAENQQVRLRLERVVGQLDFNDFAASATLAEESVMGGNVNLSPEQRWISEATYEIRFLKEGIFSIGLRHDEITDAIDVIPLEDGLSAVGNIGTATHDQLKINLTLPTDKIGISGGKFGFSNSWNTTSVTDPTTGQSRPISSVRPSQAQIRFEQTLASGQFTWGGVWIPRISQFTYQPDQISGWRGRDYYELWAEYKHPSNITVRAQLNIWDTFNAERTVFSDRDTRQVAFVENRFIDPRTFVSIRLRKAF